MLKRYPAFIHKDADSDYGISFPDYPGCISAGQTLDEAVMLGKEALQFHLDGLVEDKTPLSEPSQLEEVLGNLDDSHNTVAVILVDVLVPGKTRQINITIDEHLLAEVDRVASARGVSRSAFLAEGARGYLFGFTERQLGPGSAR